MDVVFIHRWEGALVPEVSAPLGSAGAAACGHGGSEADRADGDLLRCACGSLLARRVPDGIELKCRRCKRTVVIPLEAEETKPTS